MGYSYYIIIRSKEDQEQLFDFLEKHCGYEFSNQDDLNYCKHRDHPCIGVNCTLSEDVLIERFILHWLLWRYEIKPKTVTVYYDEDPTVSTVVDGIAVELFTHLENIQERLKRYFENYPLMYSSKNIQKLIQELDERYNNWILQTNDLDKES